MISKAELKRMPYVKSKNRPHMSIFDRSAQFMPFSALTGHGDQISETSRITDSKILLDEYEKLDLNEKLQTVLKLNHPLVDITYFVKDQNKEGGTYLTVSKYLKKYDEFSKALIFDDLTKIEVSDIVSIDHQIFNGLL